MALIDGLADKKIELAPVPVDQCDRLIDKYYLNHLKELTPFHLQITKFVQAAAIKPTDIPPPDITLPQAKSLASSEEKEKESQSKQDQSFSAQPEIESQISQDQESGTLPTKKNSNPQKNHPWRSAIARSRRLWGGGSARQ